MHAEERSPCIGCDRLKKNKKRCAQSCEKLEMYQESLPRLTLWRGESSYHGLPGLQRTPSYRMHE
jgi:hypothetical protein